MSAMVLLASIENRLSDYENTRNGLSAIRADYTFHGSAAKDIKFLLAELSKYRTALEFYADRLNWIYARDEELDAGIDYSPCYDDAGAVARAAIEEQHGG